MVGHALGMVARAHGNHAALTLLGVKLRQFVAGPPLLERGGELQVLELEKHLRAGDLGERFGGHQGGAQQVAL